MKKFIALLLVGIMAMTALVGCSSENEYSNPYSSMTLDEIAALLDFEDSYKGIEISQTEINEMWEEQFESAKSSLLTAWAEEITASSENKPALKDGDTANIDYVGVLEGETEPFEKGSDEGYDLVLGSDSFIDGFEDGLIGKKVGDTVELKLTFPEEYSSNTELQGKNVTFTVTINSAKSVPAYDDALIKKAFADNEDSLLKYTTVAEYEAAYLKDIYASIAFEEYANATKVLTFPNDIINEEYSTLMDSYISIAKQAGTTLEGFVTSYYAYMYIGAMYSSLSDFQDAMKQQAATQVKSSLLIYYVYNSNKDAIDAKIDSETDRIVTKYADSISTTMEELNENYSAEALKDLVLEQLVYEYIGEQAVVVDDVVEETATPTHTHDHETATPTATADAE